MSGIVGHTLYAMLGAKAAEQRRLPVAPLIRHHFGSYLAGSYLGSDVQTMPEAVCVDTGREVGYGTAPIAVSPLTGGKVSPFTFVFRDLHYMPRQIHERFYGRAHVVFGWGKEDLKLAIPWDHLPDYCALVAEDALDLFGPSERPLAYVFGWMVHLVSDSMIKSIQPGITLNLLDGKYTPKNRPIQDLVTYHEVGVKELQVNWRAVLADVAESPVEPVQVHYMRVGQARGQLARTFSAGWLPDQKELLLAVLAENRRYLRVYNEVVLKDMELKKTATGWQCSEALSKQTGGLTYAQMVEAAEKANFRHALWQMGEAVADLFGKVVERVPRLRQRPDSDGPGWKDLTQRWRHRP